MLNFTRHQYDNFTFAIFNSIVKQFSIQLHVRPEKICKRNNDKIRIE